jgi:hypothetical protein
MIATLEVYMAAAGIGRISSKRRLKANEAAAPKAALRTAVIRRLEPSGWPRHEFKGGRRAVRFRPQAGPSEPLRRAGFPQTQSFRGLESLRPKRLDGPAVALAVGAVAQSVTA